MKFDKKFRTRLEENLILNKEVFGQESIKVATENFASSYRVALSNVSDLYFPFEINIENIIENINKTISEDSNFRLKIRNDFWEIFRENEVEVNLILNSKPELHSKEELQLRVDYENFEYQCEDEFWAENKNLVEYKTFSNFNCFFDFEFLSSDLKKIKSKGNHYNYEAWSKYIFELSKEMFSNFKFDESKNNGIFRFLKPLGHGLYFGFEYDSKYLIKSFKQGEILLPYFNMILINDNFDKKKKFQDYIFSITEDAVNLGILSNPFFYHPTYPLKSFSTIELYHYGKFYPDNIEPKIVRKYNSLKNGNVVLIHSEEYGEKLKKHAFFYMKLLSYFAKSYINYIEKSIIETT